MRVIKERVGIFDGEKVEFREIPVDVLVRICASKKEEPIQVSGRTYLGVKVGSKYILRPISGE